MLTDLCVHQTQLHLKFSTRLTRPIIEPSQTQSSASESFLHSQSQSQSQPYRVIDQHVSSESQPQSNNQTVDWISSQLSGMYPLSESASESSHSQIQSQNNTSRMSDAEKISNILYMQFQQMKIIMDIQASINDIRRNVVDECYRGVRQSLNDMRKEELSSKIQSTTTTCSSCSKQIVDDSALFFSQADGIRTHSCQSHDATIETASTARISVPISTPSTAVNSNSVHTPASIPDTPVSVPDTVTVPAPVYTSVSIPVSVPESTHVPAPVSTPVFAPESVPVSTHVPVPVSTTVSATFSVPVSAHVKAPVSTPVSATFSVPMSTHIKAPVSTPVSVTDTAVFQSASTSDFVEVAELSTNIVVHNVEPKDNATSSKSNKGITLRIL